MFLAMKQQDKLGEDGTQPCPTPCKWSARESDFDKTTQVLFSLASANKT